MVSRFPEFEVSPEDKLIMAREAEEERQRYLAMITSGNLPPGLEILEIPSRVAGQPPRFHYNYKPPPDETPMIITVADARKAAAAAKRAAAAAGTTEALTVGESSSQTLQVVENLKPEKIR